MTLQLNSLEQAIQSLEEAIMYAKSDLAKDDKIFRQFRNSVIQCFEFSYERCWKMLKRQLEIDTPSPTEVDSMNFNDMMREAAVRGLINNPVTWMNYRKMRNITSHAYNEKAAHEVYETAIAFLADANNLLAALRNRNS